MSSNVWSNIKWEFEMLQNLITLNITVLIMPNFNPPTTLIYLGQVCPNKQAQSYLLGNGGNHTAQPHCIYPRSSIPAVLLILNGFVEDMTGSTVLPGPAGSPGISFTVFLAMMGSSKILQPSKLLISERWITSCRKALTDRPSWMQLLGQNTWICPYWYSPSKDQHLPLIPNGNTSKQLFAFFTFCVQTTCFSLIKKRQCPPER